MPAVGRVFWYRVGQLLSRLKQGAPVTVPLFAKELEISESTAHRLIDALRDDYHAPLKYDQVQHTWVLTDPYWDLPTVPVSVEELAALGMASALLRRFPERFSSAIRSFTDKLRMELEKSPDGAALLDLVSVSEPTWSTLDQEVLQTVLRALGLNRKLEIDYESPWKGEKTNRTVEPKHLLLYNGNFYLVAFCELRRDSRLFHLSFVKKARLTDESCERDIVPIGEVMDAHGVIIGPKRSQVKVRLSGPSARRAAVEQWHSEQRDQWDRQGRLVRSFPVRGTVEIIHRILSYGAEIEVLAPKRLKDMVRDEVRAMARAQGLID